MTYFRVAFMFAWKKLMRWGNFGLLGPSCRFFGPLIPIHMARRFGLLCPFSVVISFGLLSLPHVMVNFGPNILKKQIWSLFRQGPKLCGLKGHFWASFRPIANLAHDPCYTFVTYFSFCCSLSWCGMVSKEYKIEPWLSQN